ncbi:hypothetical protein Nepgr_030736 [Nepenthes gracilis]|uniref:Uncharacterized protein n=1 Tax=Nepenthes gracilis TaxID=150966 RepID=A0AAD3TFB7_NEPGR|nr:hypothetical protein Nepgr_030736 [Nepenthes gracilis]
MMDRLILSTLLPLRELFRSDDEAPTRRRHLLHHLYDLLLTFCLNFGFSCVWLSNFKIKGCDGEEVLKQH